jgi:hypothetical protein
VTTCGWDTLTTWLFFVAAYLVYGSQPKMDAPH